jgi:hypothetical protein
MAIKGMNFTNIYQNEYSFEEKINENFRKIDNFLTLSVIKKITSLNQKNDNNALYLIDKNEDNTISDKINQIACYNANSGWFFYIPKKGDIMFLQSENKFYYYTIDNSWEEMKNKTADINVYSKDETYNKKEIDEIIKSSAQKNVINYNNTEINIEELMYKSNNLDGLTDKNKARENLEVYSKNDIYSKKEIDNKLNNSTMMRESINVYSRNDTYSKKEVDRKLVTIQVNGKLDANEVILASNNLDDLKDKDKARENLEVCSKDEVLKKENNLLDIEDVVNARTNLDVYSKNETFDRAQNLLDVLDQDAACHNIGTLRDWEIHRIGDYKISAVKTDHDNWLICDGRELKRDEYPKLFEIIGTECGEGDGNSTFNLPDCRNKTIWGANGNLNSTLSSGLPNIYGRQNGGITMGEKQDGAIHSPKTTGYVMAVTHNGSIHQSAEGCSFDASKCNPIYGKTDIVQPPALCVNVFIKAK